MDASLFAHIPSLSGVKAPQIDYEFQDVCLQCESHFGKSGKIWALPYEVGVTESMMRDALKICKFKQIKKLSYFLGIIKNKKK